VWRIGSQGVVRVAHRARWTAAFQIARVDGGDGGTF